MTSSSLYDTDVLAWSEQQAEALRSFSETSPDLDVDWQGVARGIEAVGRWALVEVETGLRTILSAAILGYCDTDSPLRHDRTMRVLRARHEVRRLLTPTMRARLDLDRLWAEAFDAAMREVPRRILGVPPSIPVACPFTLDDLLIEGFSYDRAVERLYVLLTSHRPKAAEEPSR